MSDLCYLVSISWPILITRPTSAQRKRSGCVQPTGHSLPLGDARGWSSLMPRQVDDLQIPKRNILLALYINAWVRKVRKSWVRRRKSWVRKWRSQVCRSKRGPEAPNRSQIRWSIVVKVKLTRGNFWIIVVMWLLLWELSALRVTLLQLLLSLDASSNECKINEGKWRPSEKPPNSMRKTGEENQETTKNILAP